MTATITSKGQITIPLRVRQKFNLKAGDQLEFDETAPVLTARRVVKRTEWEKTLVSTLHESCFSHGCAISLDHHSICWSFGQVLYI